MARPGEVPRKGYLVGCQPDRKRGEWDLNPCLRTSGPVLVHDAETHPSSVTQKRWSSTSSGTVQEAGSHVPWGHSGTWTPPSVASAPKGPCHCLCSQPWKREDRSGGRGRGAVCYMKETHHSCSRLRGRIARGPCLLTGTAGRRRPTGQWCAQRISFFCKYTSAAD